MAKCSSLLGPDPVDTPISAYEHFWKEMNCSYAYFCRSSLSWDSLYQLYRSEVSPETTRDELLQIFGYMLSPFDDKHLKVVDINSMKWVDGRAQIFEQEYNFNDNDSVMFRKLNYYTEAPKYKSLRIFYAERKYFLYGTLKDSNFGYLYVPSMRPLGGRVSIEQWQSSIDEILNELSKTVGLIIDLRGNGGGNETYAEALACRLIDSTRQFAKSRYRNGVKHDDFSKWHTYSILPSTKNRYQRKIVILTDSLTYSAAEWFTLALRECQNVIHAGGKTGGALGSTLKKVLPYWFDLVVTVSQTEALYVKDVEGNGILPAVVLDQLWSDGVRDSYIEDAVEILVNNSGE